MFSKPHKRDFRLICYLKLFCYYVHMLKAARTTLSHAHDQFTTYVCVLLKGCLSLAPASKILVSFAGFLQTSIDSSLCLVHW